LQQSAAQPKNLRQMRTSLLAPRKEQAIPHGVEGIRRLYGPVYRWMALTDVLCVVMALYIAYQFKFHHLMPSSGFWLTLSVVAFVTIPFNVAFGLYRVHQYASLEEFRRVILGVTMSVMAIVMLAFWNKHEYSRLWLGSWWLLALLLTLVSRRLWHHQIRRRWAAGDLTFDTLIIGTNGEARHLADLLTTTKVGFKPLGFVSTSSEPVANGHPHSLPVLGSIEQLRDLVHRVGASCVFMAATAVRPEDVKHVLKARRLDGVEIRVTASFPAMLATTRVTPQAVGGVMALSVNAVRLTRSQAIAKRVFDVVLSSVALALLSPLLLAIGLAIKLTDPGPILFRQTRVGQRGRHFTVLKFRTMVVGADAMLDELLQRNEADGCLFKMRDDPRVTPIGRLLRRLSLDELPQLWNVLRGEMSLVGPRPLPSEVESYEEWQLDRLEVPPGITGLWQVSGRSELSFDEFVRLDLFYIENWSLTYDLYMLFKTIPMVFGRRGAY
jgi:exopolysaccharide biosynthesis polyprenyl glycosylphosphotransferase